MEPLQFEMVGVVFAAHHSREADKKRGMARAGNGLPFKMCPLARVRRRQLRIRRFKPADHEHCELKLTQTSRLHLLLVVHPRNPY